jgi:hypothetical protein
MPARGAASTPASYSSTVFLDEAEYYAPLPRRPLSSGDVPNPDPFIDCIQRSVALCGHQFTGPGFRSCLYGMLTVSNLLPAGVASTLGSDVMDAQGGHAAGLSYYCPSNW